MVATARIPLSESTALDNGSSTASTMETLAADALERFKDYAKDEPVKFALCAFGIGFVLGWRVKPW